MVPVLWSRILNTKYIRSLPLSSSLQDAKFKSKTSSVVWNSLLSTLLLILRDLYWQVGRGNNIFIGLDPIVGINEWQLSHRLIAHLHQRNLIVLKQAQAFGEDYEPDWISSDALGMIGEEAMEWEEYTSCLREASIELIGRSNKMVWSGNNQMGTVTAKLAYLSLFKQSQIPRTKW